MVATEPSFRVVIPPGFLPEEAHELIAREAVRRGVPFAEIVKEALLAKAGEINGVRPVAPVREGVAA